MKPTLPARGGRIDATQGSIVRSLIRLAGPILTSNVAMVAYGVGQMLWLGRSGADAVAVVAMGMPIMVFCWAIGDGFVMGGAALAARYAGSGDDGAVNRVAGHVVLLVLAYYFLLAIFAVPIMERVAIFIGTPADIASDVALFVRILLLGMPLTEIFYAYSALLQGIGNSVTPMKMFTAAMLANMILDPLLILGMGPFPALGVGGAAAGIIICRGVAAVMCVFLLMRGTHGVKLTWDDLRLDSTLLRRLVKLSLPIGGERLLQGAEQIVLVSIVAGFGAGALAAYGVGTRILSLATMPGFAVGTAVTTLVGQNLGARRPERGEQATWTSGGLTFLLLTVLGVGMAVLAEPLISLFNAEPEVLQHGIVMLRILGPTVGLFGVFVAFGGTYRALERTGAYLVWVLISSWLIKIPLALIFPAQLGTPGIWLAIAVSNLLGASGTGLHLKRCFAPAAGEAKPVLR